MNFYAHTKTDAPETEWQLLKEHLLNTARITQSFALSESMENVFYLTGLLHDLGKYQIAFQEYLKKGGKRGSVPHACWGAGLTRLLGMTELVFAIDGHHKGIPNMADCQNDTNEFKEVLKNDLDNIHSIFKKEIDSVSDSHFLEAKQTLQSYSLLERELLTRILYSALVDADWLDTEQFYDSNKNKLRIVNKLDYDFLLKKLESYILSKSSEGDLNKLRNETRNYAVSLANKPPAFYSLNLPTGMGKTLTSLSWALHHAKHNNLKRIIIVLPYINIIDQTAEILKSIWGNDYVLEHHSGYNDNENEELDTRIEDIIKQLATENWEYPIIVTTTVQYFESLFSNKRAKCRKIHNIAESVVIFDEVQNLKKELLLPTLTMLKNMNKLLRTSFLFCTATQPAFESREGFDGISEIQPLVANCEELFLKTQRVEYISVNNFEQTDLSIIVELIINQTTSVLCVVNTKKSALKLFREISKSVAWGKKYHLSTSMCPAHRKDTIKNIRQDLTDNKKIIVISTQLIEAGVDFDFPCVFRESAPMESIIQAAGRCNRENRMVGKGKVYIFRLKDAGRPNKQYESMANHALDMIKKTPEEMHSHTFFHKYYRAIISLFVDTDKNQILDAQKAFNFASVADAYKIIDTKTESVFIWNFNDESRNLYKELNEMPFVSRDIFRKLQNYMVQVYPNFLIKNDASLQLQHDIIKVWIGKYDTNYGITDEDYSADELIV